MTVTLRPVIRSDLDAIHRLQRRIEQRDGVPVATPREEFEAWLDEPYFDLPSDVRWAEVAGEAVAWGRVWHQPSRVREERVFVFGGVDPDHRGRGIGSMMLAWQIARGSEILRAATPGLPRFIRSHAYDFQIASMRLFERHGMVRVRYGDEMLRDLESLPEVPRLEGVEIGPWDEERSEEARAAQNDAFSDHWGSTPRDAVAWEHMIRLPGTRLDLSFMAIENGRVAGVCRNGVFPGDEAVSGRRDGWIIQVGVVRSHRKRGIATALIAASLAAFKVAGLTHSALGVDSENPTGAYRLYERLGYRRMHRQVVYQMEPAPA